MPIIRTPATAQDAGRGVHPGRPVDLVRRGRGGLEYNAIFPSTSSTVRPGHGGLHRHDAGATARPSGPASPPTGGGWSTGPGTRPTPASGSGTWRRGTSVGSPTRSSGTTWNPGPRWTSCRATPSPPTPGRWSLLRRRDLAGAAERHGSARIPFEVEVRAGRGPRGEVRATGWTPTRVTARQIRNPRPVPDGRRVAFTAFGRLWVQMWTGASRAGSPTRRGRVPPRLVARRCGPSPTSPGTTTGRHIMRARADGRGAPERLTRGRRSTTTWPGRRTGSRIVVAAAWPPGSSRRPRAGSSGPWAASSSGSRPRGARPR
jgi:hypothetical protein